MGRRSQVARTNHRSRAERTTRSLVSQAEAVEEGCRTAACRIRTAARIRHRAGLKELGIKRAKRLKALGINRAARLSAEVLNARAAAIKSQEQAESDWRLAVAGRQDRGLEGAQRRIAGAGPEALGGRQAVPLQQGGKVGSSGLKRLAAAL
eukprot:356524-Chlamydomonas_euryale.AAC.3